MNILVLTDPYGKPSYGPRLRYLCDYWVSRGHRVRVITEQFESIPFAHDYPIDSVLLYRNSVDWAIKSIGSLLWDWKNRYFSQRVIEMTEGERYDIVFCTTFSTFPLRAAKDVARHKHIPLHVDLRDLDEQVPGAQYQSHRAWWTRLFRNWYRGVNIRRRNRVIQEADSVSTVSPWHVDFVRRLNPNVHLVYNGYDPRQFYFEPMESEEFMVSYIGKIYEFQHPEPLFRMLRSIPGVKLNLHTPTENPIATTAVGDEIRRSSVMIVLTDPSAKGMMTTKFFESLGCEKPQICYPSDHGLLSQTFEETNAGIASDNLEEIRRYVEERYREWKQQGYTHQAIRHKETFSRENGANILEKVLQDDLLRREKRLHMVCFDIPYPANYGGAIDVYYRIRELAEAGIGVVLHCTYKGELTHYAELENLCEKVYYYSRELSLRHLIGRLPLSVAGRPNKEILQNLLQDEAPILYEGLVSCGTIAMPELKGRHKYFRECNVEHDYYRALAKASHRLRDKIYYLIEAIRLERFEKVLGYAKGIFALAHQDETHFATRFPEVKTTYMPCFHAHDKVMCPEGIGKGILYHGNLRVEENVKAAEYILREVAPKLPEIPFTIAGIGADRLRIYSDNVTLVDQPDEKTLAQLVRDAQVHLLITFQATGLKLKLLNVLYEGRHVVCNPEMVCGTELGELCHVAADAEQLIEQCKARYQEVFSSKDIQQRQARLRVFDNRQLATLLIETIYANTGKNRRWRVN